ncbi:SURF1 family protein [Aquimonas voraii]|uniref:SURF1 family protein n=1 Tax=Aquimonas voraii TaxID=265719 RepID=UPI00159FB0BC|nr:SURF1 family protein [Aquimonas voraii]
MSAGPRPLRHYLLAALGLGLAVLFCGLANWQWSRSAEKQALLDRVEVARSAPARDIGEALADPATRDLPVRVASLLELRAQPRLLLDNQQREGRVGLREYALARVPGEPERWLLVDLGWLAMAADRSLPTLSDLPTRIQASGLLTGLPGQGIRLAPNPAPTASPSLINYLDAEELSSQLNLKIVPRLLRLDPDMPIGHARDLNVLPNTLPPAKHQGYALQWAGLSLAALVITFLLFFRSRA